MFRIHSDKLRQASSAVKIFISVLGKIPVSLLRLRSFDLSCEK
jgi:hypothetical protein